MVKVDVVILESDGMRPRIDPSAQIAGSALISGDVSIGPETRVAHGAVLVSEGGPIHVGTQCLVMGNAVIREVPGQVTTLGARVLVAHTAISSAAASATTCFWLPQRRCSTARSWASAARCGSVEWFTSVLPSRPISTVPIGWVAVGTPAIIRAPGDHDEIWEVQQSLDFPGYVFRMDRPPPGQSLMPALMPRYLNALRRIHADDSPTKS
jgi:hypothetical protein